MSDLRLREAARAYSASGAAEDGDSYWAAWLRAHGPLAGEWQLLGSTLRIEIEAAGDELRVSSPSRKLEGTDVSFDGRELRFTLRWPEWDWSSTSVLEVRSPSLLVGESEAFPEVWSRVVRPEATKS